MCVCGGGGGDNIVVLYGDSIFSPNPMRGVVKTVISMRMREKLRKFLLIEK